MGIPYAEVIGDPIDHSKSPLIHEFWLEKLGLIAEYRAVRVEAAGLASYLASRCSDPFWRGCSVTAPLKEAAAAEVADPTGVCRRLGACNAVFRSPLGCGIGANTDLLGVAEVLTAAEASLNRVCVVGTGGAARAVLECLRVRGAGEAVLLARQPDRARAEAKGAKVYALADAAAAMAGASCAINASPLGMDLMPAMPQPLLEALSRTDAGAAVIDLVYAPLETEWLRRGRELGRRTANGLTALVGQAAPAFELFFGAPAPREHDRELRERLET
ncbi:MAG TPA: shikimate dehydrogenase [Allosphingosinicella sp.]|jgi:shikimate dehydrogenase